MRRQQLKPTSATETTLAPGAQNRVALYAWLAVLLIGPAMLAQTPRFPMLNQPLEHYTLGHLGAVLVTALLGVVLASLILYSARQAHDARMFLVGTGFLSIASLLVTHALATPAGDNYEQAVVAWFSIQLSLLIGSLFLACSGLNFSEAANRRIMRAALAILAGYIIAWLGYSWLVLAASSMVGAMAGGHTGGLYYALVEWLEHERYQAGGWLTILGVACAAFAAFRHAQLYRQAPSQFGLALLVAIALFGEALLIHYFAESDSLLFWLYHGQGLLGFGAVGYVAFAGLRRGVKREQLIEQVLLGSTRVRLQAEYAGAIEELMHSLANGVPPPAPLRTALRERLGMPPAQIRLLDRVAQTVAEERRQRHELERLNTMLRQAEQHKLHLTQMVVHDLKNPLTALIGYLEILGLGRLDDDQQAMLTGALRSSRNLSALIGDLLDIARLEEGRIELERSRFAIHDLLHDCADELGSWIAQEHKQVLVQAPADVLLIHGDLRLLRRMVQNLLSNAIKHTPIGTNIRLRALALPPGTGGEAPGVLIEVEDDGPGIPPTMIERIFDRFSSGASNNGQRQSNSGLGLTFCRLAAEAHGGTISAANAPGGGAIFQVRLPGG